MFKYLFSILFFFYMVGTTPAFSQSTADTIVTSTDSGALVNTDSAAIPANATTTNEADENSLYRPVMDSAFLDQYAPRQVSQKNIDKYLVDPEYAYANDPQYWKENNIQQKPGLFWKFLNNKVFQWILFLGVLLLILFGFYRLARENNFKWLIKTVKQTDSPGEEPDRDDWVDYDKVIQKYQQEGNYRMAVRFMYLRLIHTAREKNIIQIRNSATNAEITRAFGAHPQATEFRLLATAYEYIFYGDFHPGQQLYERLQTRFLAFQQILSD